MHNFSDEELISIYKNEPGSRRQKAFDCLYLRYSAPLTHYFYFALQKDYEKARDFFHDLFLKILETPDKFDSSRLFKPWIYRVASNMCLNEFRKASVASKFNDYILHSPASHTGTGEKQKELNKCIRRLSHDQRSLIVLRFKINLSIKEIAEIFECPEGTIKSRLFYATKELSNLYKKQEYGK